MKASQEDIPKNGIARQGMHMLNITRYCQITLQSECTNLLSYPNVYTLSTTFSFSKLNVFSGLPWWRSGWESACRCRGHGFELWSGRIPHAAEQLGPWATTTEPARLELVLCNKRGRDSERPAHRDEEWPPLAATRESPRAETKTQYSQK